MFIILSFLLLQVYSNEIVYSNGLFQWKLYDSAMIKYHQYQHDNSIWLGGFMQRSDTIKFNGITKTIYPEQFCFISQWYSNDNTLKMKIRMYPYNYTEEETSESGVIITVVNNTQTCISTSLDAFHNDCKDVVKYVSIQLYDIIQDSELLIYFNDIQFLGKSRDNDYIESIHLKIIMIQKK